MSAVSVKVISISRLMLWVYCVIVTVIPLILCKMDERRLSMDYSSDDSVADKDFVPPSPPCRISSSSMSSTDSDEDRRSVHNQSNVDEGNVVCEAQPKKRSRKRQRNEQEWKVNKRKDARNKGLEYVSSRKKLMPAKKIRKRKDCLNKCVFKCSQKITDDERLSIFTNYYKLSSEEKRMFLLNNTNCLQPDRRRKGKNDENSKKKVSYQFFFTVNSAKIKVCKDFFCDTLVISQKPIYNIHKTKKNISNTPVPSKQGKHTKRATAEEDRLLVKEHINSFPRVPSHYCRKDSSREYLERFLTIKKMYSLYISWIAEKNKLPVKQEVYRRIFCNDFNIYFQKPKKDRCDLCEEVDINFKEGHTLTIDLQEKINRHKTEKMAARSNRDKDRKGIIPVLCFDLENVLSCPKAEVSNFFYKSKFSTYNMTGHLSTNKKVYCAIWSENTAGRSGNDIASAVYKILTQVLLDNPHFTSIILWSDSCVPQNRNSIMSFALRQLIDKFSTLEQITLKFSTPGHSCIQEIDNVHSCIDRVLLKAEYYSPISLMRLLLQVNSAKPYSILQMSGKDFFNFQEACSRLKYSQVPFSKVTELRFTKSQLEVSFKCSHTAESYTVANLRPQNTRRNVNTIFFAEPKLLKRPVLCKTKTDNIRSMYRWMPTLDKEYYEAIFRK